VREEITTKWSVSGLEPERAAEIASWAASEGFHTVKVKVGIEPGADLARVKAVRSAVGDEIRIGVDANGGWSRAAALRTAERLKEYDIFFVEQPLTASDIPGMAHLRRRIGLPLIADESLYSPQDAVKLVRADAADVFSVYVGKAGGIGPARRITAIAESAGIACTIGSNLEMGVGTAAMIHLAMASAAVRSEDFPCDVIGPLYYEDDLLLEPLPVGKGKARPLERPGLGVELDEKKIQRYRVC
jgi:muconate cycloisomerase